MADHTTTALLASIKRRGQIPSTDETLATADFLAIADEELHLYVVPLLLSVREEYLVATQDLTIVSGTASYPIPPRAIGGKLRDVLVDSGTTYVPLLRVEPERRGDFTASGSVQGYLLEGNNIILMPTPSAAGTLKIKYFRRPSKLVATSACGLLTAGYAAGTTALVLTATAPATFVDNALVDIVGASPGFESANDDRRLNVPSTTSVPVDSPGLLVATSANDYMCLAGESPIPQVPVELHGLLAQRTAYRCLEALGSKSADMARKGADDMHQRAMMLLAPRVEGATRVVINHNGPGWGGRRRRGY